MNLREKINASNYDTDIRPLLDQSARIDVQVFYSLISIMEVDDVNQKFTVNGFFKFLWKDELFRWDPALYGGLNETSVRPTKIWRPRVQLINAWSGSDPFEDDDNTIKIFSTGDIRWVPNKVVTTSCQLDMRKYPFDQQTCSIQMIPMHFLDYELQWVTDPPKIGTAFFFQNKGWFFETGRTYVTTIALDNRVEMASCVVLEIGITRRPTFIVINIILPVVALSFLNNWVFLIPMDSGERISFVITVLLSISVTMSTVSSLIPQASDAMPAVVIYLFVLLIGSCVSTIATIAIEYQHKREMEIQSISGANNCIKTDSPDAKTISGPEGVMQCPRECFVETELPGRWWTKCYARLRRIVCVEHGNRISVATANNVCLVSSMLLWFVSSLWYLGLVLT